MTIHDILTSHHITQSDLSRRCGIPYRTVQDWAAGRRVPPDWVVMLISYYLEHLEHQ